MYLEDSKINKIEQLLEEVKELRKEQKVSNAKEFFGDEKPMDNQDVCIILNVTPRTLQRYRDRGIIQFSKPFHKIYYNPLDVAAYLNKYGTYWQKQAFEEKYGNKGE
jgi:hypothetical protein